MLKLGIVDSDTELVENVIKRLEPEYFEVVFVLRNGKEALKEIIRKKPEVLILNDIMPRYSGFDVLHDMKDLEKKDRPHIIFTSNSNNEIVLASLENLGIDEFVAKPYDLCGLHDRLMLLYGYKTSKKEMRRRSLYVCDHRSSGIDAFNERNALKHSMRLRKKLFSIIANLLIKSGICVRHDGFNYAAEGIEMICDRRNIKCSVTNEIYPHIAKEFDVSVDVVEYGIRNAIKHAWSDCGEDPDNPVMNCFKKRPSNSEFLHMLAHHAKERLTDEENLELSQLQHPEILI